MSVHHHNSDYYDWLRRNRPTCIACGQRTTQLHHSLLVGSTKQGGLLPRRWSSYNVLWVCVECHRAIDSEIGERNWIKGHFVTKARLYAIVMRALHDYIDHLYARYQQQS